MPTRKITRAVRRPRGAESQQTQTVSEFASLVDLLNAVQKRGVSLLPVSSQRGLEILGRGLSGAIQQSTADISTVLAFKEGVPSKHEHDTDQDQDWYSLVTEVTILQHPAIRANPHVVDLIGVSFYVESTGRAEERRVWPLLVTSKVNVGDLSTVLRGGHEDILTESMRLQLFAEVAEAVYILHSCGVAHGDLKPENILIETSDEGETNCFLIDFGSSVIRGQIRLPTTDEPWSAPELDGQSRGLGFDELAQTDLFSCGLVFIHLLLPLQILESNGLCLVRQIGKTDDQWGKIIHRIHNMKRTDAGKTLGTLLMEIVDGCEISEDRKGLLRTVISSMICAKFGERSLPWGDFLPHIKELLSHSFNDNANEPVSSPPGAFDSVAQSHPDHTILNLAEALGEFDDTDYVLRANIAQDLLRKAKTSACETCKLEYAFQVAICHTIGFGCMRDADTAQAWLSNSGKSQDLLNSAIQYFSSTYRVPGRVESTVLDALGIRVVVSAERTEEYQVSRRLESAEMSLRNEIEARTSVFGETHRCGAKLRSELALVLKANGRLEEAERYQREAVSVLTKHFGERHPSPLLAQIVLADILSGQGRLLQAVDLHRAVQPILKEVLGPEHPETITAMQILANTLVWLGQYKDAEEICRNVVDTRSKTLARTHPLTIRAQFNLVSILRAEGLLNEASSIMSDIDEKLHDTLAGDDLTKAHLNVVKAMLWRDLRSLEQATKSVADALQAVDRLKLPEDDALRLSGLEVLASIHGASEDWEKEEVVLRQVLHAKRLLAESKEKNREFYITKCLLAENLLSQSKLDEAAALAEQILETEVRSISDDPENYVTCVKVLISVMSFRGQSELAEVRYQQLLESCKLGLGESHELTLGVVYSLGIFFANEGKFDKAQFHYENALQHLRDTSRLGKDAFKVAKLLAIAYREQGQFAQAVETCQEGITWATAAVGENHIETLDLYNVLADTYTQMGRLSEAEDLYLTRLEKQSQGSYMEIWVKDSMAQLRKEQGRRPEATALKDEAYQLLLQHHGKMHPDVLKMAGNLLRDLLSNEKLTDKIVEDVLENIRLKRQVLGPKHPSTIISMSDLAYAYAEDERYDESEKLFNEILEQGGADSIQSPQRYAALLGKIAELHFRKSNLEKAEELERKALDIRQRTFGHGHRAVLLNMSNLASTLHKRGRLLESEEYLRLVVTGYEKLLSEEPDLVFRFLKSRIALAAVLYFQQVPEKLNESVGLYSSTVEAAKGLDLPSEIVDVWESDLNHVRQAILETEG